jgi:hypothetical protein
MPTNRDRDKNTENIFPIPSEVAEAIKKSLSSNYPFNFGLYFNKWLWVCADDCGVDYKFQARPELKSYKSGNGKYQADEVLNYYGKIRKALNSVLMSKLKEREELCKAFEKIGYSKCSSKVKLETPLNRRFRKCSPYRARIYLSLDSWNSLYSSRKCEGNFKAMPPY